MKTNWIVMALLCGCGQSNELWSATENLQVDCGLLGKNANRQGILFGSEASLDMALMGPGFFVLNDKGRRAFTRRGTFNVVNADGFLARDEFRVQVFKGEANILGDLDLASEALAPSPTSQIRIVANLDLRSNSGFSSALTLYDVYGAAYPVEMRWIHEEPFRWTLHVLIDGEFVLNGIAGTPTEIVFGDLKFNESAVLESYTERSEFVPRAVGRRQHLTFKLFEGVTQFAFRSEIRSVQQDGYGFGTLSALRVRGDGNIEASYTNGISRQIARMAIALFARPQALQWGREHFVFETPESGGPLIGIPGGLVRGEVVGGALEQLPESSCPEEK